MNIDRAYSVADKILQLDPKLYKLCSRHIGIVAAHAELWCAKHLHLSLSSTIVARGADALASVHSPAPLRVNNTVQIKGREKSTMHITLKPDGINWLCVVTYSWETKPISVNCYLVNLPSLTKRYVKAYGTDLQPLRLINKSLRLEWSTIFKEEDYTGPVKGSGDTWDDRAKRARLIRSYMYVWRNGEFRKLG